ncbi:hypothetical protein, partial [Salmonella enterica]|uniref:hypothetical protein n=1 Tax=Salmonella enterica TaxID=28901 RepID=UPI0032999ECD
HEELDGNFQQLVTDIAGKAASGHTHDAAYAKLETAFNKGNITSATTFNLAQGALQYATVTGAVSWAFSNWPASGTL